MLEKTTYCYRVWFASGTALLVDAFDSKAATAEALRLASGQGDTDAKIRRVELLDARDRENPTK